MLFAYVQNESGEPEPPTEVLLEGFEEFESFEDDFTYYKPLDMDWNSTSQEGVQTDYVTQGSSGMSLTHSNGQFGAIELASFTDFSDYSSFKLDVKQASVIVGPSAALFYVTDGTNTDSVGVVNNTSAQTLTLTPSTVNLSSCKIGVQAGQEGYSLQVDNLRGVLGSGGPSEP